MTAESISIADAANALGCRRVGIRWLAYVEELDRTEDVRGNLIGVTAESVRTYKHWLASSTPYERLLRRTLIHGVGGVLKGFLRTLGGLFSVPWN